jgi:hypothetical protein
MWQTPETAPKDGTPIVWLLDPSGAYVYFWHNGSWYELDPDGDRNGEQPFGDAAPGRFWTHQPTELAERAALMKAQCLEWLEHE